MCGRPLLISFLLAACSSQSPLADEPPAIVDKSFQEIDANDDNLISFAEWESAIKSSSDKLGSGPEVEQVREGLLKFFSNLDKNGDRIVTPSEWQATEFKADMGEIR